MMYNNIPINQTSAVIYIPEFGLISNVTEVLNSTSFSNGSFGNVSDPSGIGVGVSPVPMWYVPRYSFPIFLFIVILLGFMIISTIIGNVFVIAAILMEKSLQGVSNYLILSLAVTDLMVAVLVMPISLVNQVSIFWYLGAHLCDMWICFDVLCCTASILHLVAISLDRFWAVSNIDYIRRRCAKQICIMIAIVWVVAAIISIPPIFGWKDPGNDPDVLGVCMISQDLAYTVFSTVGAFYFPMTLMIILNLKIYMAARSRIRRKHFSGISRPVGCPTITKAEATTRNNSSGSDVSHDEYTVYNGSCVNEETAMNVSETNGTVTVNGGEKYLAVPSAVYIVNKPLTVSNSKVNNNNHKRIRQRDRERTRKAKVEMKRERKAARVLGIITGAFLACWLPFFFGALVGPFCGENCFLTADLMSTFLWLGYFNSLLNPIIYTIFNPSFRTAFRKLIYRKYRYRR
ncbi:5-hydroxytryptamine receptor-like [Mizuhopecten yessoensis]|uniref:5-hydroxytryptamine receptor n=1 Tax=Mizuhopecten yessoensis TaxID=6573 RepID=A0A210PW26_MIZYE|nr:5-hydroxytryptamine receptor-like [Mizuhopecten yessoensis]XP_021373780.1 5-hydroxytryptamine receptor-like [Mizuhopecten yessoensis]OWF40698.1 5-hydroxytryptamine receptor [Mizuhopecten yessoensis]